MRPYDVAIAGGGPAGAALAIELARAGRSVVLLEKERGPHNKVCGEFISREGAHYLARLGICLRELGAQPIEFVRLARKREPVTAALPFPAFSLSRMALDEALLCRAQECGAEVKRGSRVKLMAQHGHNWAIHLRDEPPMLARNAFLATGKHDLREWRRPEGKQPGLIALKTYWQLRPDQAHEVARHTELFLFPDGYAGLQPIEDGSANLCLLVRKRAFATRYRSWEALLSEMIKACPHLGKRLSGAVCLLEKPLAIAGLPYGYVAHSSEGPWRVGDQAAVIPSFSGDGMSIALHSALIAAQFYLRGKTSLDYHRCLRGDVLKLVSRATTISQFLLLGGGQWLSEAVSRRIPSLVSLIADRTRIPEGALSRDL